MSSKAQKQPAVNEAAPPFELRGADGRSYSLAAALEHGPVLVAFFKVSCPTCQYAFPFLERVHREFGPRGGAIWGVSQDSGKDSLLFAQEFGITFPFLIDDHPYEVSDRYGVQFTPTLFLVGRDGKIEVAGDGFSKADLLEIQKKLASELSATAASLFSTHGAGAGIQARVTLQELGLVQARGLDPEQVSMRKLRRPKPFRATKEAKRLARLTVGAPPPSQVLPDEKRKPPKHKKKDLDLEAI